MYIPTSTGFLLFYLPLSLSLKEHRRAAAVTIAAGVLFATGIIINLSTSFVRELYMGGGGFYIPEFDACIVYFSLPSIVFFFTGVVVSVLSLKKARSALYMHRIFYFLAASLLILAGLLTNLTHLRDYSVDIIVTLLGGLLLTYAILRKRLLGIKRILVRWSLWGILLAASIGLISLFLILFSAVSGNFFPVEMLFPAVITQAIILTLLFNSAATGRKSTRYRQLFSGTSIYLQNLEKYSTQLRKVNEFEQIFMLFDEALAVDFPLSGMLIHLLREQRDELAVYYAVGSYSKVKEFNPVKDKDKMGKIFKDTNFILPSECRDDDINRLIRDEYGEIIPDILIAFKLEDELLGLTAVKMSTERAFYLDSEDYDYLKSLSEHFEDAILRAYAYSRLRQDVFNKENLIKDINHRVKNNLQMIIGLLSMQGKGTTQDEVKEALDTASRRVATIAKIHEMLYIGGVVNTINLKEYIEEVVKGFDRTHTGGGIIFDIDIPNLNIETEKALTFCLVVNELVSNAVKYAFKDGKEGRISVSVKRVEKELKCRISDNGCGIKDEAELGEKKGIGHDLVKQFIEGQLKGRWQIKIDSGTIHEIAVPLN